MNHIRSICMIFMAGVLVQSALAQKSIEPVLGLSGSKSGLGLSYRDGDHELNVGLRGLAYSSRDGFMIQPGIAYNHYLTTNGFYIPTGYLFSYQNRDHGETRFIGSQRIDEITRRAGWHSDFVFTGLGKSFQFTRWGLHLDALLMTPADSDIGRLWGWSIGGAASYRFKLD